MKKRDLFPMNEMDLKFINFILSIENFGILEMQFDTRDIDLQHTLNIVP